MITARPFIFLSFVLLLGIQLSKCQLPDLSKTSRDPIITVAGADAYLSCKVESLGDNTVLFKRLDSNGNGRILTADTLTVIADKRFSTLHERRHTTWLLRVQNVTIEDSGLYLCEVSSSPPVRVTKLLKVMPAMRTGQSLNSTVFASISTSNNESSVWPPLGLQELSHNYTGCCASSGVPEYCFGYCEFSQLLSRNRAQSGGPVHSQACFKHIGSITKCLADGRNHQPCCERQNIPSVCQPICGGNFNISRVTDYFTCMDYVAPMLACIGQGIQTLPPPPQQLRITPFTDRLLVKWNRPALDAELIEYMQLNVTQLHGFDEPGMMIRDRIMTLADDQPLSTANQTEPPPLIGLQYSYRIPANRTEFNVTDLKSFTIYEVVMQSFNRFGHSLPTEQLRIVTRLNGTAGDIDAQAPIPAPGELVINNATHTNKNSNNKPDARLPDIKQCCVQRGVTLDRCVDILCDPTRTDEASLADLMICAPWANVTFACMAQGVDHRPCCASRGVPSTCGGFCDGSVRRLDFRHFVCVQHLPTYQSCLLQHFDVLPGAPSDFHLTSVHAQWAVFRWRAPTKNANRITAYHVHYRRRMPGESMQKPPAPFQVVEATQSPFLLDGLEPNARYEVWIGAANEYGLGQPSARLIFSTPPPPSVSESDSDDGPSSTIDNNMQPILINNGTGLGYNETNCCQHANISSHCMPLCTYEMSIQDVLRLAGTCGDQLPGLVRCGSGGRNHIPCCQRRGVDEACLNLCAGIVDSSPLSTASRCSSDMGKILRCMEEGTGIIPGQPQDLRAIKVTNNSIQLLWRSADEDRDNAAITYQVRYGRVELDKPLHPLDHENSMNTTSPMALITSLEPEHTYSVYVVAGNSYGISLPSLVLLVNTSQANGMLRSTVGPPHALELLHQSVDTLTFSWLPPLFLPPDCTISYVVHYRPVNGTELRFLPGGNSETAAAVASSNASIATTLPKADGWIRVQTRFNTMIITNLTYNTQYALAVQAKVLFRNDSTAVSTESGILALPAIRRRIQLSGLSEMLLVWTDPAIPASVNLPVIIPNGPIIEGHNATALCVTSGTPTPTLSIYVNGILVRREERRHLTFTMTNIRRNVSTVTCYAINGYGPDMQSSQSTLELKVRFRPSINTYPGEDQISSPLNSTARLQCEVTGNPQPAVTWHRQADTTDVVELGDHVDVISTPHNELPFTWINTLLIKNLNAKHSGKYLCQVSNYLGKAQKVLDLSVDTSRINDRNYTDCCERENVSSKCMKVCHFDIDIQMATTIPECYKDLDKLMYCAADGSDHRQCCRRNQVPPGCVHWCRGSRSHSALKEQSAAYCALAASPTIVKCFQEGSAVLPGPVHQLRLLRYTQANRTALVSWSVPEKNAELVQFYRVYYRPIGSKDLVRNTTNSTNYELTQLDPSKLYEFVIKAGNSFGLSVFSEPLVIDSKEQSRLAYGQPQSVEIDSSTASKIGRLLLNMTLVCLCLGLMMSGAYFLYERYSYKIKPPPGSVAFENPTYMKDSNQVVLGDVHHLDTLNNNSVGATSNQNNIGSATIVPSATSSQAEGISEFKDLFK